LKAFKEGRQEALEGLIGPERKEKRRTIEEECGQRRVVEMQQVLLEAKDKIQFYYEGLANKEVTAKAKRLLKSLREELKECSRRLGNEYQARVDSEMRAFEQEKCFWSLPLAELWDKAEKWTDPLMRKLGEELKALKP